MKLKYILPVATLSTIVAVVPFATSCSKKNDDKTVEITTTWDGDRHCLSTGEKNFDTNHIYRILFNLGDWDGELPNTFKFRETNAKSKWEPDDVHIFKGEDDITKSEGVEWERDECILSKTTLNITATDTLIFEITFTEDGSYIFDLINAH